MRDIMDRPVESPVAPMERAVAPEIPEPNRPPAPTAAGTREVVTAPAEAAAQRLLRLSPRCLRRLCQRRWRFLIVLLDHTK